MVLAYIHAGLVHGKFCASLVNTVFYDANHSRRIAGQIEMQSSPRIAEARSQIVDKFAEHFPDAEWLLMVDSDMSWSPEDVYLLLQSATRNERPIVGGLCFTWDGVSQLTPTLYRLLDHTGRSEAVYDYPRDTLVQVDSTGAAFVLIHRQVFAKMKERFGTRADGTPNHFPWFQEGLVTKDGVGLGEDTSFFLKAKALGIPVHVHTGARIGHTKAVVLTEAQYTPPAN